MAPVNILAIAVVGVGVSVAIIGTLNNDRRVAVFGILIGICLMAILLILGWAKKHGPRKLVP